MKVYIVLGDWQYDGGSDVLECFDDKLKAESFLEKWEKDNPKTDTYSSTHYDFYRIEEIEVK